MFLSAYDLYERFLLPCASLLLSYFARGLYSPDAADKQNNPRHHQADHDLPLRRPSVVDGGGDVQRLSVPEVVHRGAVLALRHVICTP